MLPPFVVNGVKVIETYLSQTHLSSKPPQMMPGSSVITWLMA